MKRVWLRQASDPATNPDGSIYISRDVFLAALVALASYATRGDIGCGVGDPIFERVTEGRQSAQNRAQARDGHLVHYSACGDLPHFLARCLGCRDESFVNRDDDGGTHPWQVGANLSRIVENNHFERFVSVQSLPITGDCMIVENAEHVSVVDTWDANDGKVAVYEYGQWDPKLGDCGKHDVHPVTITGREAFVAGRKVAGWLCLELLPFTESAIVPDDFPYGVPDTNPYPEAGVLVGLAKRSS